MSLRMRIAVQPEGREGVWLADRGSLKAWITAQNFDEIHSFIATGSIVIGIDHNPEIVLLGIDRANRVALMTGAARRNNLNHALALILPASPLVPDDEQLEMYDIGEITEDDLAIGVPLGDQK